MGKRRRGSGDETSEVDGLVSDISEIVDTAQRSVVRSTNAVMTAAYWCIGRRIVEEEQAGSLHARYGENLLVELSQRLSGRFGRVMSDRRLREMRAFYVAYPDIWRTLSAKSNDSPNRDIKGTIIDALAAASTAFQLPWSHYVRLLSVRSEAARRFYEVEALRGGWTERQLSRQISTQFFERTVRAQDREAVLQRGRHAQPDDHVTVTETIKEPFLLEFLGLKDEYSEGELEEAIINRMQAFLLELGGDFAFVARQKRLRIDDDWFRVDLVFYHRRLRCLVIIDLKRRALAAGDAGQINLYCNYAREHWMIEGENPPIGLVLCTEKGAALAHYAFEGLGSKVLATEYKTILPSETELAMELARAEAELRRRQLPASTGSRKPPKKPRGGRAGEPLAPWIEAALLH